MKRPAERFTTVTMLRTSACFCRVLGSTDSRSSPRGKAKWNVKVAIVMQKTGLALPKAQARLRKAHDSMREAIGEDIEPRLRGMLQGHAEAAASIDTEAGAGSGGSSATKRGARSK